MPTLPFWLRWASRQWESIKAKVDSQALNLGLPTYSEAPKLYRFEGWGLAGIRLACNVKYMNNEYSHDFGRVVA